MKRKHVMLLAILGLLFGGVAQLDAQQTPRFGYINSERILAQAPAAQAVQRQFEQEIGPMQAQLDTLERAFEQAQEQFQRQQSTLSADARQQRTQSLQQQYQQLQQRAAELEQRAQERRAELIRPLMQRISQVIEQIRTEGNYALIFDAAGGGLIAGDPALDLTDRVLQRLGN